MKNFIKNIDFSKVFITVVGDIILNRYIYGNINNISNTDFPMIKINTIKNYPGGAGNIAINISKLGARVCLVGLIGNDENANILLNHFNKNNVLCKLIKIKSQKTITKYKVFSNGKKIFCLDNEKYSFLKNKFYILNIIQSVLFKSNILILSDYNKGTVSYIQKKIIDMSRKYKIPVLIDTKVNNFSLYAGSTILISSVFNFPLIIDKYLNKKTLIDEGMNVIINNKLSALLITKEVKSILLQKNKKPICINNIFIKKIFNTVNSKDTVISFLALFLAIGKNLDEISIIINQLENVIISQKFTSNSNKKKLDKNFCLFNQNIQFGIINEEYLEIIVNLLKQQGEKIVMTNGVFDILHAGHISYLTDASKLGDKLIVAVNTDESTRRLKGSKRPINSLQHRMEILSSLKVVDWVVSFKEDTPYKLIVKLLPNVLVKGGDYLPHEVIGNKEVLQNGGFVKILNFKKGLSTSSIIHYINEINDKK